MNKEYFATVDNEKIQGKEGEACPICAMVNLRMVEDGVLGCSYCHADFEVSP